MDISSGMVTTSLCSNASLLQRSTEYWLNLKKGFAEVTLEDELWPTRPSKQVIIVDLARRQYDIHKM